MDDSYDFAQSKTNYFNPDFAKKMSGRRDMNGDDQWRGGAPHMEMDPMMGPGDNIRRSSIDRGVYGGRHLGGDGEMNGRRQMVHPSFSGKRSSSAMERGFVGGNRRGSFSESPGTQRDRGGLSFVDSALSSSRRLGDVFGANDMTGFDDMAAEVPVFRGFSGRKSSADMSESTKRHFHRPIVASVALFGGISYMDDNRWISPTGSLKERSPMEVSCVDHANCGSGRSSTNSGSPGATASLTRPMGPYSEAVMAAAMGVDMLSPYDCNNGRVFSPSKNHNVPTDVTNHITRPSYHSSQLSNYGNRVQSLSGGAGCIPNVLNLNSHSRVGERSTNVLDRLQEFVNEPVPQAIDYSMDYSTSVPALNSTSGPHLLQTGIQQNGPASHNRRVPGLNHIGQAGTKDYGNALQPSSLRDSSDSVSKTSSFVDQAKSRKVGTVSKVTSHCDLADGESENVISRTPPISTAARVCTNTSNEVLAPVEVVVPMEHKSKSQETATVHESSTHKDSFGSECSNVAEEIPRKELSNQMTCDVNDDDDSTGSLEPCTNNTVINEGSPCTAVEYEDADRTFKKRNFVQGETRDSYPKKSHALELNCGNMVAAGKNTPLDFSASVSTSNTDTSMDSGRGSEATLADVAASSDSDRFENFISHGDGTESSADSANCNIAVAANADNTTTSAEVVGNLTVNTAVDNVGDILSSRDPDMSCGTDDIVNVNLEPTPSTAISNGADAAQSNGDSDSVFSNQHDNSCSTAAMAGILRSGRARDSEKPLVRRKRGWKNMERGNNSSPPRLSSEKEKRRHRLDKFTNLHGVDRRRGSAAKVRGRPVVALRRPSPSSLERSTGGRSAMDVDEQERNNAVNEEEQRVEKPRRGRPPSKNAATPREPASSKKVGVTGASRRSPSLPAERRRSKLSPGRQRDRAASVSNKVERSTERKKPGRKPAPGKAGGKAKADMVPIDIPSDILGEIRPRRVSRPISPYQAGGALWPDKAVLKTRKQPVHSEESGDESVEDDPAAMENYDGDRWPVGAIVWAYWPSTGSDTWWPGLVIEGDMAGQRRSRVNQCWVAWFGDHKVSELPYDKVVSFCDQYKAKMVVKSKARDYHKAVMEAVKECWARQDNAGELLPKEELMSWAMDMMPDSCLDVKINPSEPVPETLMKHLNKYRGANTSPEKTPKPRKRAKQQIESGSKRGRQQIESGPSTPSAASVESAPKLTAYERKKKKENEEEETFRLHKSREDCIEHLLSVFQPVIDMEVDINHVCIGCDKLREAYTPHPIFEGGLCFPCKEGIGEVIFSHGPDGATAFCQICGSGGELIICEDTSCGRTYCKGCILLFGSQSLIDGILKDDKWKCFVCVDYKAKHKLIKKRDDWKKNIVHVMVHPSPLHEIGDLSKKAKPKIRVLSLFDGIGTAHVALDKLGFDVEVYYACEIEKEAKWVTNFHHKDIIHLGDVRGIDDMKLQEIGPIDLLVGGSPCNDLSLVNPARKGLYGGTGILFFEYHRILSMLKVLFPNRPLFWMYENVCALEKETKATMCRFFYSQPAKFCSSSFAPMSRPRYFWGNIPGMYAPLSPEILMTKVILQDKLAGHHRLAMVDKVRVVTTRTNSLLQGPKENVQATVWDGEEQKLWSTDIENLFGFPTHYTDVANLPATKRQKLVGKAWCVDVVVHIFKHLRQYYQLKGEVAGSEVCTDLDETAEGHPEDDPMNGEAENQAS